MNVVRGGKTPEIELADAERMGYAIAILPGLLLGGIISVCDQLAGRREAQRQAAAGGGRLAGQDLRPIRRRQWDERRTAFRDVIKAAAE